MGKIYEHDRHCNMQTGVLGYIATSDVQTSSVYVTVTHNMYSTATSNNSLYNENTLIKGKCWLRYKVPQYDRPNLE